MLATGYLRGSIDELKAGEYVPRPLNFVPKFGLWTNEGIGSEGMGPYQFFASRTGDHVTCSHIWHTANPRNVAFGQFIGFNPKEKGQPIVVPPLNSRDELETFIAQNAPVDDRDPRLCTAVAFQANFTAMVALWRICTPSDPHRNLDTAIRDQTLFHEHLVGVELFGFHEGTGAHIHFKGKVPNPTAGFEYQDGLAGGHLTTAEDLRFAPTVANEFKTVDPTTFYWARLSGFKSL